MEIVIEGFNTVILIEEIHCERKGIGSKSELHTYLRPAPKSFKISSTKFPSTVMVTAGPPMVGRLEGVEEGVSDGKPLGCIEGGTLGNMDGDSDGSLDGSKLGKADGRFVGVSEGTEEGPDDGASDGTDDG